MNKARPTMSGSLIKHRAYLKYIITTTTTTTTTTILILILILILTQSMFFMELWP
jgi:hypothetical protein